jgi:DNA-binding NarL/FixJ family response regulator
MVTQGLTSLLRDHVELVGVVHNGGDLVEAAKRLRPDVIVTDVSMPGITGLEALHRITAANVDAKVIFLTMHNDPEVATEALRAGARGFLLKHCAGEELIDAIEHVLQGRVYLTPMIAKDVISRFADPTPDPPARS